MLLRGCILRNTRWCYGLVIFAGRDTKLMMNSGKAKFKRTSLDKFLNVLIIGVRLAAVLLRVHVLLLDCHLPSEHVSNLYDAGGCMGVDDRQALSTVPTVDQSCARYVRVCDCR